MWMSEYAITDELYTVGRLVYVRHKHFLARIVHARNTDAGPLTFMVENVLLNGIQTGPLAQSFLVPLPDFAVPHHLHGLIAVGREINATRDLFSERQALWDADWMEMIREYRNVSDTVTIKRPKQDLVLFEGRVCRVISIHYASPDSTYYRLEDMVPKNPVAPLLRFEAFDYQIAGICEFKPINFYAATNAIRIASKAFQNVRQAYDDVESIRMENADRVRKSGDTDMLEAAGLLLEVKGEHQIASAMAEYSKAYNQAAELCRAWHSLKRPSDFALQEPAAKKPKAPQKKMRQIKV